MSTYLASQRVTLEQLPCLQHGLGKVIKRQRLGPPKAQCNPIDVSTYLAALRANENPLVSDTIAGSLVSLAGRRDEQQFCRPDYDLLITKFMDEQLLKTLSIVNMERSHAREYRQVVLLVDAFDTRPFRLPWPPGTLLFLVAPGEAHEKAEAVLAQQRIFVPRGCLLRRVPCDISKPASFADTLLRAGFQSERLSVWSLQGSNCFQLDDAVLYSFLTDISNLAAFDSFIFGEWKYCLQKEVDTVLASFGLLGSAISLKEVQAAIVADYAQDIDDDDAPWLFVAQQKRLSLDEMATYGSHVSAAEETDEDFFGNFS